MDRIYIGRGVGGIALTGVGVCLPVIMIVTAFAALACAGGAPRTSIFMGQKDDVSAEKTMGSCLLLEIMLAGALTAVLLIWNRPLLLAFGASKNTIEFALDYMNIYSIGTVFVLASMGMNAFITAQGFTKISMLSVLIGAGCNIVLDPIFIFALGMGVAGAALATIISQCVSAIWMLCFLLSRGTRLRLRLKYLRLAPDIILPCLFLGLAPFIIIQTSESILAICFNSSLLKYGGDIAVAAMTVLSSVMQLAMLPFFGIGYGAQPIISYNYGAGNSRRVREAFWLLLKCSLVYSMTLWALIMLFPGMFISLFNKEAELLAFAHTPMRIYAAMIGIFGIQEVCQTTLNAIGYAKPSIMISVTRKFFLLIPLIYIMPHLLPGDPTMAVYISEPIADLASVIFTTILFRCQFRYAMDRLESAFPS